jgi:hypothetical protein
MSDSKNNPPILNPKNKVVFNKIILIYSIFYLALKLYAIIFLDQWLLENLIISLPIIIVGGLALYFQLKKLQSWPFILLSFVVAILLRLYESEWILKIHDYLN